MTQREINRSRQFSAGGLYSRGVVRTRGFVPVSPPSETEGAPIRIRRAVRTRGEAVKVVPWQELKPEELDEWLEELREAQDSFPITIVVENVQDSRAQKFLDCLYEGNLLGADDALWIVGEGQYENVVPEEFRKDFIPKDAYLNAQEQEDKAVMDALTPELVFVAAVSTEELMQRLEKWQRRVWAIIVADPDGCDFSTLEDLALGIPGKDGDRWRLCWPKG